MKKPISVTHLTSVHPSHDMRIYQKQCRTLAKVFDLNLVAQASLPNETDDVKILSVGKAPNRFYRMTVTTFKVLVKALKTKAALYHFHDPELIPVGLLLKCLGYKVIYDVHENLPHNLLYKHWIPLKFRKTIASFVETIENFSAKRFDLIVAATSEISDRFIANGCRVLKIANYPLVNNLENQALNRNPLKKNTVCYIGGISKVRGIFEMISAIEQTDLQLNLAGEFNQTSVAQKAKALKGWSQVNELGFIDQANARKVMHTALAGLVLFHPIPAHLRAEPNKLFEYMSAGLPVIASDFPLWRSIIDTHECGLCVDPSDIDEMVQAIMYLKNNPDKAKVMGENGQRAVLEHYNWNNESSRLLNAYRDLLTET